MFVRRIEHILALGVAGDPNALRDSSGVLRVLGAIARDQYVVSLRA